MVSNTYCVVCFFISFIFLFCVLCYPFLWIVHCWLPLRFSLPFIQLLGDNVVAFPNLSKETNWKLGLREFKLVCFVKRNILFCFDEITCCQRFFFIINIRLLVRVPLMFCNVNKILFFYLILMSVSISDCFLTPKKWASGFFFINNMTRTTYLWNILFYPP